MSKLLIVDDEQSICWGVQRLGESIGFEVATASSAEQAIEHVSHDIPDVIVLDVRLPGMDGLTAMHKLQELCDGTPIIVITAYGDLSTAVEAIRQGAFEYIVKPFELDKVEQTIQRAFASRQHQLAAATEISDDHPAKLLRGMIGKSAAMQEVFKRIALAAMSDACVLLMGESGTGKELAARAIHQYSHRSQGPFVPVNVAALNPSLAESELFGHVKGSFTGADYARIGYLQQADGGTLFLDEVADIPMTLQVKLLRCLENGEVTPVGSSAAQRTDFRLICATHQDLQQRIAAGEFRHDLYFRLSAFQIDLPPLRQRGDDLIELSQHFLEQAARKNNLPVPTLAAETIAEMKRRRWHGNVRELQNVIEHAVIVARGGAILPEHLPAAAATFTTQADESDLGRQITALVARWSQEQFAAEKNPEKLYDKLIELIEPPLLETAMQEHHNQYLSAARSLGLHRTTLKKKLGQYDLEK